MSNNTLNGAVVDPCLECGQTVRSRQEAIQCENCSFWQHRTCKTGITRNCYQRAVRGGEEIVWKCASCLERMNLELHSEDLPLWESTRVSPLSIQENSCALSYEQISSPVDFPNPSIPHSPNQFTQDLTNDQIFDDSDEIDIPNISTENTNLFPDFVIPDALQESSLDGSILESGNTQTDDNPTFRVITNSSQKGKDLLIEKVGYSYIIKLRRNMVNYWRCSVRNKSSICPATIIQRGNLFTRGINAHNHLANPEVNFKPELKVFVINRAKREIFVPAAEIVENALIPYTNNLQPGLPSLTNLARTANRARQAIRPQDPVDLDFEVNMDYIPGNFLRGDIKVDERRHLIFATDQMLNILCRAKRWYLDGTFKIVKEPFTQLFSIHAFVNSESSIKQLPLVFVLMSGKRKRDYRKVLNKVLESLPGAPAVRSAVIDFELALWKAFPKVYPGVVLQGCSFHWTQAVWRKIQLLGLQSQYMNNNSTRDFCRRLMALPFLPCEHIEPAFRNLEERASNDIEHQLTTYIRR